MSQGRKYTDKEIAEIFKRAAEDLEASRKNLLGGEGLSLEELQDIGKESGIPPDFIARAASALDDDVRITNETLMGIQIGTGRTLELPRRLTEFEWEELVMDLRTTFNARGRIRQEGAFRSWTNGNLQFLLEPKGEGSRLVMKTVKGSARQYVGAGLGFMLMGLVIGFAAVLGGKLDTDLSIVTLMILLGGLSMFLVPRFSVPQWANLRKEQMRGVGARVLERMDNKNRVADEVVSSANAIELESDLADAQDRAPVTRGRLRG